MKNEIMSKSDVRGFVGLFLGLSSYSVFMFYLLAKRSKGINYFDDLYSINKIVVYFLVFLQFILLHQAKKYAKQNKTSFVNFLWGIGAFVGGVLLASFFFTITL